MDIRIIETKLTYLFQETLSEKKLYDTGQLIRTANIMLSESKGIFNIKVFAEEYLLYLNEKYKVTYDWINKPLFKELINDLVFMYIEEELKKSLNRIFQK